MYADSTFKLFSGDVLLYMDPTYVLVIIGAVMYAGICQRQPDI